MEFSKIFCFNLQVTAKKISSIFPPWKKFQQKKQVRNKFCHSLTLTFIYHEGTCFQLPLLSHGTPGYKLSFGTKASRKMLLIMKLKSEKCGNSFHDCSGRNSRSALSSADSSIKNFNVCNTTWSTLTQKLLNCIKSDTQKTQNHKKKPHTKKKKTPSHY